MDSAIIFFMSHSNIADSPAISMVEDARSRSMVLAEGMVLIDG